MSIGRSKQGGRSNGGGHFGWNSGLVAALRLVVMTAAAIVRTIPYHLWKLSQTLLRKRTPTKLVTASQVKSFDGCIDVTFTSDTPLPPYRPGHFCPESRHRLGASALRFSENPRLQQQGRQITCRGFALVSMGSPTPTINRSRLNLRTGSCWVWNTRRNTGARAPRRYNEETIDIGGSGWQNLWIAPFQQSRHCCDLCRRKFAFEAQ